MSQLHPFFSYFGSKYRLAKYYPKPEQNVIIEPFAGSAGYSLLYHTTPEVYLYEIYDPIVELWDYLIHVSEQEILSLPIGPFDKDPTVGIEDNVFDKEHPIDAENIPAPAKTLLGFWNTESQTVASRYPLSKKRGGNWTAKKRAMIASQLKYIRHWKIEKCSYIDIPNRVATWYIDPPYEEGGKRYKFNKIDYKALGDWCQQREGQVIVCEQDNAKWLDFQVLDTTNKKVRNASNEDYKELIWHRSSIAPIPVESAW